MNEPKYRSVAKWPKDQGINLGNTENESEDTHQTREEAEAIAAMLQQRGFGGDGRIFPIATRIEEIPTKPAPVSGMTPEQMDVTLARALHPKFCTMQFYGRSQKLEDTHCLGYRNADTLEPIPRYTKNANATLEIVEMMRNRGWQMKVLQRNRPGFSVFLYDARKEHEAHADTLPLAICTAALKALGHLQ